MSVQFTQEDEAYVSSRGSTYSAESGDDKGIVAFLVRSHVIPAGNGGKYALAVISVIVIIAAFVIFREALSAGGPPPVEALPMGYSM